MLTIKAPLPPGYHYQFDRCGGSGAPFFYNIAVVSDDYQGGDWIDVPGIGGFQAQEFIRFVDGMLEGLEWKERISRLPRKEG